MFVAFFLDNTHFSGWLAVTSSMLGGDVLLCACAQNMGFDNGHVCGLLDIYGLVWDEYND